MVVGVVEEHPWVAREPRANGARQQHRRAEAAIVEVLSGRDQLPKRRPVQERELGVRVGEVEVHKRVQQVTRGKASLFKHGKLVLHEALEPL